MDYHELMIAGTGGRGILLIGRLLARAGMYKYKHVSFFPNYGPAMRGGESECTVILSDNFVGSPVILNPAHVIVMASSMLTLMEKRVKPGGFLILDSSVIPAKVARDDITIYYIPATEKAVSLGDNQAANMVLLGAYVEASKALTLNFVEKALEDRLQGESKRSILSSNKKALNEGAKLMASYDL